MNISKNKLYNLIREEVVILLREAIDSKWGRPFKPKPIRTDHPLDVSPQLVADIMSKLPQLDVDQIMTSADDQGLFDGMLREKLAGEVPTGDKARYRKWDKNDPFAAVRATFDPETKKRTFRNPLIYKGAPSISYYVFDEKPKVEHVVHMIRRFNTLERQILFNLLDERGIF
jgi:hypothetical protein